MTSNVASGWASGAAAGAAATYLDGVADGLHQYSEKAVSDAKGQASKAVGQSGILNELGLVPAQTLILIAVSLVVLVMIAR